MTRSGYSGASTGMHSGGVSAANADAADGDITLFADDIPKPYIGCMLCATRDGNNQALMTWNAELLDNCSMYKMYRILTSNNPVNVSVKESWDFDAVPSDILNGLGDYEYKSISVDEGDLYRDWINADTYEGYYVIFLFIYNVSDRWYAYYYYPWDKIVNYCIGSAPSLTYNQSSNSFTIGTSMAGKRILEFHRTDRSYGYPTSVTNQDTLNEMLLLSMIQEESWGNFRRYLGYYNAGTTTLERWAKGSYTVGVNFKDNTNKSRISAAINFALSEINSVLKIITVYILRARPPPLPEI